MNVAARVAFILSAAATAGGCGDLVGVDFGAVHLAANAPDAATSRDAGHDARSDAPLVSHDDAAAPKKCALKSCKDLGATCDPQDDGCGGVVQCGSCADGGACLSGHCDCRPTTCPHLNATCGEQDDGCGHAINCGSCLTSQVCANNSCSCEATTCAKAGFNCGDLADGCGSTLLCGTCQGTDVCGGGGPNLCGPAACSPTTCASQGTNCGTVSNGCGVEITCGSCTAPETCGGGGVPNVCGCTATTCATLGSDCGNPPDGCGNMLSCGSCTAPESCAGGGAANVCGCTPTSCGALGATCGAPSDSCGGNLDCGTCTGNDVCVNGTCTCIPDTCDGACGTLPNGCGGTLHCGTCSCFGAGTEITMADGSHRPIEGVHVDDRVMSYDATHAAWVAGAVRRTLVHPPEDGTGEFVVINGGLRLTSNHPVWIEGHGKRAELVEIGDRLVVREASGLPTVALVRTAIRVASREVTYDLDVGPPGNFVAGSVVVEIKESPP